MTKEIVLKHGQIALVDDEDYENLAGYSWHVVGGYAQNTQYLTTGKKNMYMHRLVMGFPESVIDHKNGNKLDNRKCNLRICTRQENQRNQKLSIRNTSKYRGVSYYRRYGNWRACITNNEKKLVFLGYFKTAEEAARRYDEESKKIHGEFGILNFPY